MTIDKKKLDNGFDALSIDKYEHYIGIIAKLTRLYSESNKSYIPYRIAERVYIASHKLGTVKDLSRKDNSFDALLIQKRSGVGIKTFVGADNNCTYKDEKIAEFTKLAKTEHLAAKNAEDLAIAVVNLRNQRVLSDAVVFGIDMNNSIYHCLIRKQGYLFIHEEPYPLIDCNNIKPADVHGNEIKSFDNSLAAFEQNLCFSDGKDIYKYNRSKNVLLKRFHENLWINSLPLKVDIIENPFEWLSLLEAKAKTLGLSYSEQCEQLQQMEPNLRATDTREYVVLPLSGSRSADKEFPVVEARSGINQWNAGGRQRSFGEAYIPVPKLIIHLKNEFFPVREVTIKGKHKLEGQNFSLHLPNGKIVESKLCQENLKALMSNPNDDLMLWLYAMIDGSLSKAMERFCADSTKNVPYTYNDLLRVGKDSVLIIKNSERDFELLIQPVGTYKKYIDLLKGKRLPLLTDFLEEE